MKHTYINKASDKTLILLHGTGGDENDLLGIGNYIDSEANLLGIRGNITERGMNRYFKRLGMGIYDIPNYISETNNLISAIKEYSDKYNFELSKATIIGFSNGANIAIGIIQTESIVNNYILLSPDFINPKKNFTNLEDKFIFISNGDNDPYVNKVNFQLLLEGLELTKAHVKLKKTNGHQITQDILDDAVRWYQNITH